jgi:hypothetical protein
MLLLQIALKLLDCDFPDESVRGFATQVLQEIPDERLEDILLQLTQVQYKDFHSREAASKQRKDLLQSNLSNQDFRKALGSIYKESCQLSTLEGFHCILGGSCIISLLTSLHR